METTRQSSSEMPSGTYPMSKWFVSKTRSRALCTSQYYYDDYYYYYY